MLASSATVDAGSKEGLNSLVRQFPNSRSAPGALGRGIHRRNEAVCLLAGFRVWEQGAVASNLDQRPQGGSHMSTGTTGSAKVHIAFAFAVPILIILIVLGITNLDLLNAHLPGWLVWLLFKLPVRLGLPLTLVAWAVYARNQQAKQSGVPTAEVFREPHMMMHFGYTVIPLLWEDGNRRDANAFHQYIHENTERQDYNEDWHLVFWHAHEAMHQWMEENPEDMAGYQQAVNFQRLMDEIAEPDFTYWPLETPSERGAV